MADIVFKCSGCSTPLAVEVSSIGQVIQCPGCKQNVLVPEAGTAFSCGSCQAHLAAPPGLSGERLDCPSCGQGLTIPKATGTRPLFTRVSPSVPEDVPASQANSRRCPYCGGEIPPAAILCLNCGTNLRTGRRRGAGKTPATAEQSITAGVISGILIVFIPLAVCGAVIWRQHHQTKQAQARSAYAKQRALVAEKEKYEQERAEAEKFKRARDEQRKQDEHKKAALKKAEEEELSRQREQVAAQQRAAYRDFASRLVPIVEMEAKAAALCKTEVSLAELNTERTKLANKRWQPAQMLMYAEAAQKSIDQAKALEDKRFRCNLERLSMKNENPRFYNAVIREIANGDDSFARDHCRQLLRDE